MGLKAMPVGMVADQDNLKVIMKDGKIYKNTL